MRDVIRYSEAFKLRLVEDVSNGKYQSLDEARRRNGIRGGSTLSRWLKQYGREDMLPKTDCSFYVDVKVLAIKK
jgi:transposase-like protein